MGTVSGAPAQHRVTAGRWATSTVSGSAAELHALELPDDARPAVWLLEATAPAVVLGSSQPATSLDSDAASAAGFQVARRRSGGGAVLLVPGQAVWVDVLVPVGDQRWRDDIGLASHWLGQVWADVLRSLGVDVRVHRGPFVADRLGALVCFAGVGPGEVFSDDAKVVGISQRRTRSVARFQSVCLLRWDPEPLAALFPQLTELDMDRLRGMGLGVDTGSDEVIAMFLETIAGR